MIARRTLAGPAAALLLWSASARAAPRPPAEQGYFDALVAQRLAQPGSASAEDLAEEVRQTSDRMVAGDFAGSAARLYLVVEGPRFAPLAGTPAFEDAEYQLGIALARGGALAMGRGYLERVAARAASSYAAPALERLVDLALENHDAPLALRRLAAAGIEPHPGPLLQEIDYLRGRAAYDALANDEAETALRRVGPRCRFFSSAVYLRGVIAVRRGDLPAARDAFCTIADEREGDPLRFVIDGRYYPVRDLARLALGRVAHEERRFDDAFYHYFSIPEDSRELPHALFESAWSMLERKRYPLALRLVEALLDGFPDSPLAAEARLLKATLELKRCRFASARTEIESFLAGWEPVARAVAEAKGDASARRALAQRLLAETPPPTGSVEARLVGLLALSPSFHRLVELSRGLARDAGSAAALEAAWGDLLSKLAGEKVQPVAAGVAGTTALLEATNALAGTVAEARAAGAGLRAAAPAAGADEAVKAIEALEQRRARLAATLQRRVGASPTQPTSDGGTLAERVARDRDATAALRARAAALATRLEAEQGRLLLAALGELDERLAGLLRHARLAAIDAVVGEKRRLEKQVQDLAAGRFPATFMDRLHIEGLIGDDEEYWPPETERWADEYEGYR